MGRKNIIAGLIILVIGISYGYLTSQLPQRSIGGAPGISFFPWIITFAIVLLSIAMVAQGWQSIQNDNSNYTWNLPERKVIFMLIMYSLYIFALPYLGFLIASVPFFSLLIFLYGGRSKLLIIIAGPSIPIIIYFIFRHVFLIPLPQTSLLFFGG